MHARSSCPSGRVGRCVRHRLRRGVTASLVVALILAPHDARAQAADSLASPSALKRLSLEELMNMDVTSVSRRSERLSQSASAIQVITGEDIRRSGATSLAEALRLAPNLHVAQVNASQWAISARGFNNVLANKLLVLIDGRTVYTPLYAGVFWDAQNPPLESIDRIEVISGPGGALWGANAVNGVINVITRSAKDTPGWTVAAAGGTELRGGGSIRYGTQLAPDLHLRTYAKGFERGSTEFTAGGDANDTWHMMQGGFRLDQRRERSQLTVQGDVYDGRPNPDGTTPVAAKGLNLLGRWSRAFSDGSDVRLQLYYDRNYRDFRNDFTEDLATYDLDWQHRFQAGGRQELIWGLGVRIMEHRTTNLALFAFEPSDRTLRLFSGFVQDEIALVPDRLRFTIGTKFERNEYTGWEIQPSARLAWTPTGRHTLWAAASRAVRTPARIDRDFYLSVPPSLPFITGNGFTSEELIAWEAGWRLQPSARSSLALSGFYHVYDKLRSAEPGPPPFGIPLTFENGVRGNSYGIELAGMYQISERWRLRGGYTLFDKDLVLKPGSSDLNAASAESDDPRHQLLIQSIADLPGRLQFDLVARFVDVLPNPAIPSYVGVDVRLGWQPIPQLELALVGQNLVEPRHAEFSSTNPAPRDVERGGYAKLTWRP